MMKKKLSVILLVLFASFVFFSEIVVLKNGKEIKGKIIKSNEDTITIITKTNEIVIDKDELIKIYYDEKEYEKEKTKNSINPIDKEKNEIKEPYIISTIPENGAIDISRNTVKTLIIKFNEPMNRGLTYDCNEEIKKPKWLDPQTLQIELKNSLDYGKTFKLILNPSGKKQIMKNKLNTLLSADTIFSFTTKDVKWTTIYNEDFNMPDTENGDIGEDWQVNNHNGSATVKIENNELVMSRKFQNLKEEPVSPIRMIKELPIDSSVKGIRYKGKFKNEFIAFTLIGNNESYGIQIYNNKLRLYHYSKKYSKETNCTLVTNAYYTIEIIREKNLLLCKVKNDDNSYIKKLSIDIPEDILPSNIRPFIGGGGNKVPFVYVDEIDISVY